MKQNFLFLVFGIFIGALIGVFGYRHLNKESSEIIAEYQHQKIKFHDIQGFMEKETNENQHFLYGLKKEATLKWLKEHLQSQSSQDLFDPSKIIWKMKLPDSQSTHLKFDYPIELQSAKSRDKLTFVFGVLNSSAPRIQAQIKDSIQNFSDKNIFAVLCSLAPHETLEFRANEAAGCASQQNKFIDFLERLHPLKIRELSDFSKIAAELSLDQSKFQACFSSREFLNSIVSNCDKLKAASKTLLPLYIKNDSLLEGYKDSSILTDFFNSL